jgi:hypothetical protein
MDSVFKEIVLNLTDSEKALAYRRGTPSMIVSLSREREPEKILADPHAGLILDATQMLEYLLGYLPGELTGKLFKELIPERFRAVHDTNFIRFNLDPQPRLMGTPEMDLRALCRDQKTEKAVEIMLIPQVLLAGTLPVVVATVLQSRLARGQDAR